MGGYTLVYTAMSTEGYEGIRRMIWVDGLIVGSPLQTFALPFYKKINNPYLGNMFSALSNQLMDGFILTPRIYVQLKLKYILYMLWYHAYKDKTFADFNNALTLLAFYVILLNAYPTIFSLNICSMISWLFWYIIS